MNEHQSTDNGVFDDLLSVAEAARLLQVSEVTLRRWIDQGRIRAYRLGPKKLRLRRSELSSLVSPAETAPHVRVVNGLVLVPMSAKRRNDSELVAEALALLAKQRAKRGGEPFPESWQDINEAREERSRQLE